MFETFDHTADVGLRARAATLEGLFAEAARALFLVMVADPAEIRPSEEVRFELQGDQPDELLRDWLGELLYTFHVRHLLFAEFQVALQPGRLTATARGEAIDPTRHDLEVEVKAITWHGLKVEREADGWLAEVIIDI